VGGLGVTVFLAATLGFFVVAWRRFTAGGVTELSVATAVAVVVSFAMALVMRQGGIIAEDADYDEKYDTVVAKAAATARRRRAANEGE
jgi:low affinity Fe/Cu permease